MTERTSETTFEDGLPDENHEAPPAPEATNEAPVRDKPRRRFLRWAFGSAAALFVALGVIAWMRAKRPPEAPPITPDVPHIEGKALVFSADFKARAGIEMDVVKRAPLVPRLRVVGTVDFDPSYVAAVGTRIHGLVRKLHKLEGDTVGQDEPLAEIESAELGEAQASVAVANARRKAARINEKRERELAERGLTTAREREIATATYAEQKALLEAAAQRVAALSGTTKSPFGVYMLRAPLAGTVVERHIFAGQSVEDHLVAFRVANLDHLWVDLAVFEGNLDAIRKDDPVEITRAGDEGEPILGRVAHVGEVVDPVTRTGEVRVAVSNEKRLLRPGQSVTAAIRASGPARTMLTVPMTAITYIDGKPTVFLAEVDDRVVPTPVELGPHDGKQQGITSGLSEGQRIVSRGVFALKSELYR